jgi:nucleotide-binding universal stress UspA family protein
MYKQILLPIDHSTRSAEAARAAIEIARRFDASLSVLNVIAPFSRHAVGEIRAKAAKPLGAEEYRGLAEKKARAALEKVAAEAKAAGVACKTVLIEDDDPADGIVATARKRKADLIVMASSGRKGIERIFLGSVTTEVLSKTTSPVLVCR